MSTSSLTVTGGRNSPLRMTTLALLLSAATAPLAVSATENRSDGRFDKHRKDDRPVHGEAKRTHRPMRCDASLRRANLGDRNARITAVTAFRAGDVLPGTDVNAPADLCLVEIMVRPGNPGPGGAPSTSRGIGIEVWLPTHDSWNQRYQAIGGGGWVGGSEVSDPRRVGNLQGLAAAAEGFVTSYTDTGHVTSHGDFGMRPDGSINWPLWKDFAERGVYEQNVRAKALAEAYYGKSIRYSYWNGCSTGGRQGLMMAQRHAELFDGILAAAPAINWERFIAAELWPQVIMREELGAPIAAEKLGAVTVAAVRACEEVPGQGYINEPSQCNYDPTADAQLLCAGDGPGKASGSACLTMAEARTVNKIWYGPTLTGRVPAPSTDNGHERQLRAPHLWYGLTRGTDLSMLAGPSPFTIATDMAAHALQNPAYAQPNFKNAVSDGENRWMNISATGALPFHYMFGRSHELFNEVIGTDDPDLRKFRRNGGKLLMWHGQADQLIMPQGTINYYERVARIAGGIDNARDFARLYMLPGVGHCSASGTPGANPAYPGGDPVVNNEMFKVLQQWVEEGKAPVRLQAETAPGISPKSARPICMYPAQLAYDGENPNSADSFSCR